MLYYIGISYIIINFFKIEFSASSDGFIKEWITDKEEFLKMIYFHSSTSTNFSENITKVDLSNTKLNIFPHYLSKFLNLNALFLNNNYLIQLTSE